MNEVQNQVVDRNLAKKILMKIGKRKNTALTALLGASVGMTEVVTSFQGEVGTHHDIYKMLFHKAIDSQKVHAAKQVGKNFFNFAAALAGGQLNASGLGELGGSVSDLEGFHQDTSGLNQHFREANYRAVKKVDRWMAANQCAQVFMRVIAHFVTNADDTVVYWKATAMTTNSLNAMYNNRVAQAQSGNFSSDFIMNVHRYNRINGLSLQAANEVPLWAEL